MGSHSLTSKQVEEQQWSITLGNTLLASIVCLLWYVFGLWEDKDKVGEESSTLTSAIEKKVTRVDKEEVACTNGSTPGHLSSRPEEEKEEEQRLYMLPEQGRQLIIDQIKLRQEESAMHLKEEKTSIEEEAKKRKTTSDVRKQTLTVFQWPQNEQCWSPASQTPRTAFPMTWRSSSKILGSSEQEVMTMAARWKERPEGAGWS